MVARHFFCYCEWIGQPPEDFSIDQDIDIYNMYMPKITEDEIQVDAHPHGDVVLDKTKINVYMDSNEPDFYEIGNLLEKLLKHAFAGRRKKLRNTIGSFVTSNDQIKEFFDYRGISLDQRPQEISPSNWFSLAKALKETCVIENGLFQSK